MLRADIDCFCALLTGPLDKVCRWIDRAGGSDDEHHGGPLDFGVDAVHFEGSFSEPDNVRPQRGTAFAEGN